MWGKVTFEQDGQGLQSWAFSHYPQPWGVALLLQVASPQSLTGPGFLPAWGSHRGSL